MSYLDDPCRSERNGEPDDDAPRVRPIIFSARMVRAILAGAKTQTRRIVTPQDAVEEPTESDPHPFLHNPRALHPCDYSCGGLAPYAEVGDRLWVRETWRVHDLSEQDIAYRADGAVRRFLSDGDAAWWKQWGAKSTGPKGDRWCPAIYMKPWSARLHLDVTSVRVERLQALTEHDAIAEGVTMPDLDAVGCENGPPPDLARRRYATLWDELNFERAPWSSNPWVWVVSFKRATP